jgi:hypothetical protein
MAPAKGVSPEKLIGKRWRHLFEEDGHEGEVYVPESAGLPLSRRPREGFELDEGGSARVYSSGADDRLTPTPAVWSEEDGVILIKTSAAAGGKPAQFRIEKMEADRLFIRR